MAKFKNGLQAEPGIQKEEILVEYCINPWNGGCKNADISLYIMYRGEKAPVCWRKISRGGMREAY